MAPTHGQDGAGSTVRRSTRTATRASTTTLQPITDDPEKMLRRPKKAAIKKASVEVTKEDDDRWMYTQQVAPTAIMVQPKEQRTQQVVPAAKTLQPDQQRTQQEVPATKMLPPLEENVTHSQQLAALTELFPGVIHDVPALGPFTQVRSHLQRPAALQDPRPWWPGHPDITNEEERNAQLVARRVRAQSPPEPSPKTIDQGHFDAFERSPSETDDE